MSEGVECIERSPDCEGDDERGTEVDWDEQGIGGVDEREVVFVDGSSEGPTERESVLL
jgi:hypothetical protein